MQKTICLFFLLMVCNASKADTIVQLVKPFKFDYPFKTTVGFTITNTSNSPKTFYAKTVFDTGTFDHKFLSWQDYLKDIKSEKGLIPQMNKIAYYEKSDRFKNQLLELDDYSPSGNYLQNVVDQKYSVLWFTAFSVRAEIKHVVYNERIALVAVPTSSIARVFIIHHVLDIAPCTTTHKV